MGLCSVSGCDRTNKITRGLCGTHYERWRRHGSVLEEKLIYSRESLEKCRVPTCSHTKIVSWGLCQAHYLRYKKTGDVQESKPVEIRDSSRICKIEHCNASHSALGLCYRHYRVINSTPRRRGTRAAKVCGSAVSDKMLMWGNKCWMCGGPFEHVDHVKPLSKGGPHLLANLRPSCARCNLKKGSKWPFTCTSQ